METLLQDIRFGFRQMMKQPGFATLAIISMALGIGADTSIFSLVDTALLRPLAVKEPSQLVELYGTLHNGADWSLQSYPNYKDYRDRNTVFSGLFVYRVTVSSLTIDNSSQRVWGYLVSGNYFDVLGVRPMLGRSFLPEEDQTPDSHPVAVISYNCWQRRFGGDPLILAAVGMYGVMSHVVARRTPEIGLRMALGAQLSDVQKLILKQRMFLAAIGSLCGLLIALGGARMMKSLLYGRQHFGSDHLYLCCLTLIEHRPCRLLGSGAQS